MLPIGNRLVSRVDCNNFKRRPINEMLSSKVNASLNVVGGDSRKRADNLIFGKPVVARDCYRTHIVLPNRGVPISRCLDLHNSQSTYSPAAANVIPADFRNLSRVRI